MNKEEAIAWLKGERSSVNLVQSEPLETWEQRIAITDAARVQEAYWCLRAHMDRMINPEP